MSHRLRILRDVMELYDEKGPGNYALLHSLSSFVEDNPKYLAALNQLLREGLVLGVESSASCENSVAIGLHPERLKAIREELSPWYRDPKFAIPAVVSVLGLIWAVVEVFL